MTHDVAGKLKAPAIGLLITGVVNILCGIYMPISALLQWKNGALNRSFTSDSERIGYYVGFWGSTGLAVLSGLLAPIIIYGAIQMMSGKKYGLSKTATIIAVIPFVSCCFLLGVPFGIWALVVLGKPEVKAFFQGGMNHPNYYPPQPPTY